MIGESGGVLRVLNEEGRLLCWLNLEHPLPLKWELDVQLFRFWEDILVDSIKLISHLNYRIKHKKSRFRRRIQIKSILLDLERKYLERVLHNLSSSSRRSDCLSYISSGITPKNANYLQENPDTNLLFSNLVSNHKRNSFNLKRLTLGDAIAQRDFGNRGSKHVLPPELLRQVPSVPKKPSKETPRSQKKSGATSGLTEGVFVMKDEYSVKDIFFEKYQSVFQKKIASESAR